MKLTKKDIVRELKNPASLWQTWLLTSLAGLAYLIRAWPYFIKPQLYAEDGVLWLSQAKNEGIKTLWSKPYAGFFHSAERVFAYVVVHFPLLWAPAIFCTAAWALFIMMTYYLLSPRTGILKNNFERWFVALSLCLIANIDVFFFNFSNSIFILGIIGALILVAKPSKNRYIGVWEKFLFFLAGMTLPFSWIYIPIVVFDRVKYKAKNTYFLVAAFVTSIIQALGYVSTHINRSPVTFVSLFSKWSLLVVYNQILIPAIRYARIDIPVADLAAHHYEVALLLFSMVLLVAATVLVFIKSSKQVWYVLFFLAGMTIASIKSPTLSDASAFAALKTLSIVQGSGRYFIFGIVGVNIIAAKTLFWGIAAKARYAFLSVFMIFGLLSSIHTFQFFPDKQFVDHTAEYKRQVQAFNSGQKAVIIHVNPDPWTMIYARK